MKLRKTAERAGGGHPLPNLGSPASPVFQGLENRLSPATACRRGSRCRRAALLALAVLALHLPLLALRPAASSRRPPPPFAPPRLRYLPLAASEFDPTVADFRVLWSPALFSLPSRLGFSAPATRISQSAPALDGPIAETALPWPAAPAPSVAAVLPPRTTAPRGPAPPLPSDRVFAPPPPLAAEDRIEPLDDSLRDRLEHTPLDRAGGENGAGWEAVVWLEFDEAGLPRHALIERLDPPETPPATRVLLQRNVRAWRAAPGAERSGRVWIQRIAGATAAAGASAP